MTDPQPDPGEEALLVGEGLPSVDCGEADPRVEMEESVLLGASQLRIMSWFSCSTSIRSSETVKKHKNIIRTMTSFEIVAFVIFTFSS